jgi:3,4-dihydroxy 2-butanone 4-phosphate synthase/GTP cyclohydrolase II
MSVDAAHGARDGASAAGRAQTIRRASAPGANPGDLVHPGHVYPLRAHPQGVLVRMGHTEAAVDLARLADARAAAVMCPIAGDHTTLPAIEAHARRHALRVCLLKDLLAWRQQHESPLELIETDVPLPTEFGEFRAHLFRSRMDAKEHLALSIGLARADAEGRRPALEANCYVRVHSECLTGDVFHSLRCDCGAQLARALAILGGKAHGVLVYMRQEGRGIGLANKLRAYRLQDAGFDTVEANQALGFAADLRDYATSARILGLLGARHVTLLTNNPGKQRALGSYGIDVVGQEPLETPPNARNLKYLRAKRDKLGHLLTGIDAIEP